MESKVVIFVLLIFFIGPSYGQLTYIGCYYTNLTYNGETHYGCLLTFHNMGGFDNFTEIRGTHREGYGNEDVRILYANIVRTVNFPQIFCSEFPNLLSIWYTNLQVVAIHENTFSGCKSLEWIYLFANDIKEVHERAFANNRNLTFLDLSSSELQSIPENVFDGLVNLKTLSLSFNRLETLPDKVFSSLTSLEALDIRVNNITLISQEIFNTLNNLREFKFGGNPLRILPHTFFDGFKKLEVLNMGNIEISEINPRWFQNIGELTHLDIYSNLFNSIPENVFDGLTKLVALNIGGNHLTETTIPENLFDNMPNLTRLIMENNLIQSVNSRWFKNIPGLEYLNLQANAILELPIGLFTGINELQNIRLGNNYIKTIHRHSFGNIQNLQIALFDFNVINAIDESFLLEATQLDYFSGFDNLCISQYFSDITKNRDRFIQALSACTRNYRYTVDTVTEVSDQYRFFEGLYPGIQVRVNAPENINIALTPFNFPWTPMIEIFIGVENNTESRIVRNRSTTVVTVPTPNILENGRWSGFRVSWTNHVVVVSREGQQFPFMAYTFEDFFPVNFYGLRSPQNRAVWSIQPIESEISPFKV